MDFGYTKRINEATVAFRSTPFKSNWHNGNSPSVIGKIADAKHTERIEIVPYTPRTGQYMKIWLPKKENLQLCEVEVMKADGKLGLHKCYDNVLFYDMLQHRYRVVALLYHIDQDIGNVTFQIS